MHIPIPVLKSLSQVLIILLIHYKTETLCIVIITRNTTIDVLCIKPVFIKYLTISIAKENKNNYFEIVNIYICSKLVLHK